MAGALCTHRGAAVAQLVPNHLTAETFHEQTTTLFGVFFCFLFYTTASLSFLGVLEIFGEQGGKWIIGESLSVI